MNIKADQEIKYSIKKAYIWQLPKQIKLGLHIGLAPFLLYDSILIGLLIL